MRSAGELSVDAPVYWHTPPADELECELRTRIVLDLAGLTEARADGRRRRLLDVGCGDGRFDADVLPHAAPIGLDLSAAALARTRQQVRRARFLAGRAAALPFVSDGFDVVTLVDVLEQLSDGEEAAALREARRVLRPGGRLLVAAASDRVGRHRRERRHYPVRRFTRLFDDFSDIRIVGLIPYFPTLKMWLAAPVIGRGLRARIRVCAPEEAKTLVGVGVKR